MTDTEGKALMQSVIKVQNKYDSEAFKCIYDTLSKPIFYICLRYLKDENEAKDALQEVFVIVYEKIKDYGGKGSFEGWVKRIAIHHCIYKLKKRNINTELREDHIPFIEQEEFDASVHTSNMKEKLKLGLQRLPDGFRTIINLYILEGYSHTEIAKMLTISEGTSRSQLNRAKAALKKIMTERT